MHTHPTRVRTHVHARGHVCRVCHFQFTKQFQPVARYLCMYTVPGQTRLARYKIGLNWPDKEDTWQGEGQLDLSEGKPDDRGLTLI